MRKPPRTDGPDAPRGLASTEPAPSVPLVEQGDAALVERARQGDDAAYGILVTRYERRLLRVLFRLVQEGEQARDLAQETFWKVYTRLDRFDTSRRFGPWLFRIGVRLALDHLRRGGAQAGLVERATGDGGRVLEIPDPDPREREDLAQEVRHVLDRLPVDYRTVLVLRDLEGFSSAEVAAIVDREEATVRWRLARAREMFRQHWQRRQAPEREERGPGQGEARHGAGD